MKWFDTLIENIKKSYNIIEENPKVLIAPILVNLVKGLIGIIVGVIFILPIGFLVPLMIIALQDALSAKVSALIAVVMSIFLGLIVALLVAILFTCFQIAMASVSVSAVNREKITFGTIWRDITKHFFNVLFSSIVIGLLLAIINLLLFTVGLIVIIPLTILTGGLLPVIYAAVFAAMTSFWTLFVVKYNISGLKALKKNVNLGKGKIFGLSLLLFAVSASGSVIMSIIGVVSVPVVMIIGIILSFFMNILVLLLEEDNVPKLENKEQYVAPTTNPPASAPPVSAPVEPVDTTPAPAVNVQPTPPPAKEQPKAQPSKASEKEESGKEPSEEVVEKPQPAPKKTRTTAKKTTKTTTKKTTPKRTKSTKKKAEKPAEEKTEPK